MWSAGFRPFYLAGCCYGSCALLLWLVAHVTGSAGLFGQPLWHAHEMLFGFITPLCAGFILTALPSWAGIAPITAPRLGLLVAIWLAGRVGILLGPATASLDLAFVPLLAAMVASQLWSARNRLYRLLLPILIVLAGGNALFHFGMAGALPDTAHFGIRIALYALMILFSFVGGLLTPIFTATLTGGEAVFRRPLEILAPTSLIILAVVDLGGVGGDVTAVVALAVAAIHALRMATWGRAGILASPLVLAMHLGYAFFVLSLVLQAIAPLSAATHAFTIGAMGLTKISLMTRVALKHTGRPLHLPPIVVIGFACMGLAALGRVTAALLPQGEAVLAAAALLWIIAIGIYLWRHGACLVLPSLPKP
jgi:uncharacterized protein involved in response to NO